MAHSAKAEQQRIVIGAQRGLLDPVKARVELREPVEQLRIFFDIFAVEVTFFG